MAIRSERELDGPRSRSERQALRQQAKATEERRRIWLRRVRRVRWVALAVLVVGGVIGGLTAWLGARGELPPTTMANHVELNPRGHILTEPMPVAIQKHMLEHADGSGPPGVIIHYNCKKYTCPPDLVANLTRIAEGYPTFVYLAPNPTMDTRIALTRLGEILVLDSYDPDRIRSFIIK